MGENTTIPFDKILMDTVTDMVFIVKVEENQRFIYQFVNQAMLDKTGLTKDVINQPIAGSLDEEVTNLIKLRFKQVMNKRKSFIYRDRYVIKQHGVKYSSTKMTPFFDDDGNCTYIVVVASDLTSEVLIERKYKYSDFHFQIIAENIQDLITLIDRRGIIIYTSPSYESVLGHNHEEYIGKHFLYNVYEPDRPHVDKAFQESLMSGSKLTTRFRQFNHEKVLKWSESHGTPVFDSNKKLKHIVVVTRDISAQMEHEKELQYYAMHDSLTGVPNRRFFHQYLESTLAQLKEKETKVAVIIFDLDNFKQINDGYGHDIGDKIIIEFSKRIKHHINKKGIIARFGGDEFVVVIPEVDESNNIFTMIERIKVEITAPWKVNNQILRVTTSIGVALTEDEKETPLTMIKKADLALYEAKNAGKNTFKFAK